MRTRRHESGDEGDDEQDDNDDDEEEDEDDDDEDKDEDEDDNQSNPFRILGVPKNSTKKHIVKVWKKLMRAVHPDKNPPDQKEICDERTKEINNAKDEIFKMFEKGSRGGRLEQMGKKAPTVDEVRETLRRALSSQDKREQTRHARILRFKQQSNK